MDVRILQLLAGARAARGLAVVIDVFRAFTVQSLLFENGAAAVIPVGDLEEAYALKKANPSYLLMGERRGQQQPGFDYGNSPAAIERVPLEGRTVVQTTSAGTQGLVAALHADEVIAGSFRNVDAIVRYIRRRAPAQVSLVCMGYAAQHETEEDTLCAEYIRAALLGSPMEASAIRPRLRASPCSAAYFDDEKPWKPVRDFELATEVGVSDFVIRARRSPDGRLALERVDVP